MNEYQVSIYYCEETGEFIADIPEIEECSAYGKTPIIALEELQKTKELHLGRRASC